MVFKGLLCLIFVHFRKNEQKSAENKKNPMLYEILWFFVRIMWFFKFFLEKIKIQQPLYAINFCLGGTPPSAKCGRSLL